MAFEKTIIAPNGVGGEYWRIIQLNQSYLRNDAVIDIALYENRTQRLIPGITPLAARKFDIGYYYHDDQYLNGDDVMRNITLKESYRILKILAIAEHEKLEDGRNESLAWFWDAEDIIE